MSRCSGARGRVDDSEEFPCSGDALEFVRAHGLGRCVLAGNRGENRGSHHDLMRFARGHSARLSFGGPCPDSTIESAIQTAQADGILVVAAAGNGALNPNIDPQDGTSDAPSYPANEPKVLAVGATGRDGYRAYYSNTGCLDPGALFSRRAAVRALGYAVVAADGDGVGPVPRLLVALTLHE